MAVLRVMILATIHYFNYMLKVSDEKITSNILLVLFHFYFVAISLNNTLLVDSTPCYKII